MLNKQAISLAFAAYVLLNLHPIAWSAVTFVPGHFYVGGSNADGTNAAVHQYDPSGNHIGSFDIEFAWEVRGIDFSRDGDLVVSTVVAYTNVLGINTFDENGNIIDRLASTTTDPFSGHGRINADRESDSDVFLSNINHFRNVGTRTPYVNVPNSVYDVEPMPSGNLLVSLACSIQEVSPNGQTTIRSFSDTCANVGFAELDPTTGHVFRANDAGGLTRYDGDGSGNSINNPTVSAVSDIYFTADRNLLVTYQAGPPVLFDRNLQQLFQFEDIGIRNVAATQMPVPEPDFSLPCLLATLIAIRRITNG